MTMQSKTIRKFQLIKAYGALLRRAGLYPRAMSCEAIEAFVAKRALKRNDVVRVRRSNGTFSETCYVITKIDGFYCEIGEMGPSRIYSPQSFDTSLVERVDRIPSDKIAAS